MKNNPKLLFHIYLSIISIAGGMIVYLATSKVGPGISTDATVYLSTAENLLRGHGLVDFSGSELTQFPPLYPILLALGRLITGWDVVFVGRVFNIMVFSGLIWATGILFLHAFDDEVIFGYIGSFVVVSSTPLIQICANIAPDPFFLLTVVIFLSAASAYLKKGGRVSLILAGILAIVACFQRYAGLSIIIAGGLLVAYKNRGQVRVAIVSAVTFCLATAAPIFLWGYLHNYPVSGSLFGVRMPLRPILNFITGVEKILYWFIPYQIITSIGIPQLLAFILLLASVAVCVTGIREFLKIIQSPGVLPSIVFLTVYLGVLVFNISNFELKQLGKDRVHIILLPSLLIVLFALGSRVLKMAKNRFNKLAVYPAVILLFSIWSVYPVAKSNEYVERSAALGDVSPYNSFNNVTFWNSNFVRYLQSLDVDGHKIYSNNQDAVWYIFRTEIGTPPYNVDLTHAPNRAYLQERYHGWPGPENEGYLIWFNGITSKEYIAAPDQLMHIANLRVMYSDAEGSAFSVQPLR